MLEIFNGFICVGLVYIKLNNIYTHSTIYRELYYDCTLYEYIYTKQHLHPF